MRCRFAGFKINRLNVLSIRLITKHSDLTFLNRHVDLVYILGSGSRRERLQRSSPKLFGFLQIPGDQTTAWRVWMMVGIDHGRADENESTSGMAIPFVNRLPLLQDSYPDTTP